jgi:CBS domain containing-hemolysin-like protein
MTPLAIFLLGCATVFLGAVQAAFSALMRLSLRLMAERGGRSDRLGHYLDDPLQLFVPLRLLLGLCIVGAGVLIARVSDINDATSVAVFVVSLIAFVVVCEHVFHAMAQVLLPVTLTMLRVFGPRRERDAGNGGNGSESEAETPANETESAADDAISEEEGRELLQSIVDFTETVAREVMTPRPDIVAVEICDTLDAVAERMVGHGLTRIPVYRGDLDHVEGIAHAKDVLELLLRGRREVPLAELLRPVLHVPESKQVAGLLREMQREKVHLAMVSDEYGAISGLVTLEDLLEELVGQIRDEHDRETPDLVPLGDGRYRVNAALPIVELNDTLDLELPHEQWNTVGGLVFGLAGRIPRQGEGVELDDFRFTVEKIEGRRILTVLIDRRAPEPAAGGDAAREP